MQSISSVNVDAKTLAVNNVPACHRHILAAAFRIKD
jgi:hypothetical protein